LAIAGARCNQRRDLEQQLLGLVEELHGPLVGDRVVDELALALPGHQAALGETGEMHRGVGLAQPGAPHDLPRAQRPVAQRLQDPEPRDIAQPPKELGAELDGALSHISME
jgi:hypothetical protein